ncbi:unnamed protein product [Rhizophagus irregularis]|uniref:Uncharacterized protein n=1 Tax=Rhizophagus irregularis TaxID=588596 RepID=A0A2I1HE76_9GLOM|nr:hypothetical protein RhiirA4_549528 [Rhizophagus irregularis]CAB4402162.1 unnamed protein product [Rhizophagus irregularis]
MIDSEICIRCEKEVEDWDHVWTCEANEFTIREVILNYSSYEEQMLDAGDTDQAVIVILSLQLKFGLRGEEVVEIERKKGIGKKDKRVRKDTKEGTNNNNNKQKKENNKSINGKNSIKLEMMNSIFDNSSIQYFQYVIYEN